MLRVRHQRRAGHRWRRRRRANLRRWWSGVRH